LAVWLVVVGVVLGGLFIAGERRWGGRGGEVGRRAVRAELMASRRGGASGEAAQR